MGTNYYLHIPEKNCPMCGHNESTVLHIGKSSGGWCFALHIIPERGLKNLNDWRDLWEQHGIVKDEYGNHVSAEKLERIITERTWGPKDGQEGQTEWRLLHPKPDESFLAANYAERGPRGLVRAKIDGVHCVGHADNAGTWDYIQGEFN